MITYSSLRLHLCTFNLAPVISSSVLFWGDFTAQHRWTLRSADSFNSSRYKYTQGQSLGKPLTHTLRQRGSLKYGKALPFKWHLRQNWSAAGRHEAWIFAKPWSLSVLGATPCFKHKQMNSLDTVPEANRDIETFISLDHRSIADKRPALNKFLLSVKFWDQQGFFHILSLRERPAAHCGSGNRSVY